MLQIVKEKRVLLTRLAAFMFVAAIGLGLPAIAAAQPALSTDVTSTLDITSWVAVVAAAIATVIAAVLAAMFAFMVIRLGIRWIGSLG